MQMKFFSTMARLCIRVLLIVLISHSANADERIWQALQEGGKIVLMRHAPVERGAGTGNPLVRDSSCKSEKNLSDQGKLDTKEIGRRFRENNIPVSKVLHSPFCRTTDTAKLGFGVSYPAEYLSLLEVLSADEANRQTEKMNQVIDSYSGKGNLIMVTHEPNLNAVSFELMKHLDFLVIDPKGEEDFEEIGVIRFSGSK